MPSRGLNRALWALVLVAIIVFGLKARDQFEAVFVGVGKLDVRVAAEDDTVFLRWRGRIEAPMANRIADAFEQHKNEQRRFVLSLSSPGGSLDQGAEVVRLLRRIGETHKIDTVVEGRSVCASMCVPVYLQGQRRTASEQARFMFHEVSFHEYFSQEDSDVPAAATARETDKLFSRYFAPAGVPDSWIRSVRAAMTGGNDIWKTAPELIDENAGIVQQVF